MLTSCQKVVHINLGSSPPELVVQGAIETGQPPYVMLTTTIGYFAKVNLGTLQNFFVHNAVVTISDGTKTITLKEYTLDTTGNNKFYVYSVDTANLSNVMTGIVGKSYTLTITYNGATYSSVTKIPNPKGLDTLWFAAPSVSSSGTPLNARELFGTYTDPDTLGNYVRYFTQRNHRDAFYPGVVFSDELVNGKRVTDIDLFAGYNDSVNVKVDSVIYFYSGDTVTLKWCEIDKGVYDFWNTYQFSLQSGGNPFSSPINVKSNISNGALGIWAGYGSLYTTLVVK